MGSESVSFEGVVIAAVGVVMGITYLLGAMLGMMANGGENVLLLADSLPVTVVIGVLLLLTAGFLGTGHRQGRYVGMMAFIAVAIFGRPTLAAPEAIPLAQTGFVLLVALYLVLKNPVSEPERSNVDESNSASKVGSTIR